MDFNPNKATFSDCLARIEKVAREVGLNTEKQIVTSRDDNCRRAQELLEIQNVPNGFKKWQLPVALRCESQMFISVGAPGIKVPPHSHDEGPGIRFIMNGSIKYKDKELTGGDWMYIPKGVKYEFEVGPLGVLMCYCYCCCCA
jgi:hypothetical protein